MTLVWDVCVTGVAQQTPVINSVAFLIKKTTPPLTLCQSQVCCVTRIAVTVAEMTDGLVHPGNLNR